MNKDEKLLYDRLIYLEKSTILNRLELSRKNTLLKISLLRSSILENKYIVGDKSVTPDEARKIESMSSAFAYERDHLNESRRNTYLMNIARDVKKLEIYEEYLKSLEEDIKKSKKRIESYERGIDPNDKSDINLDDETKPEAKSNNDGKSDIGLDDETKPKAKSNNDKSDINLGSSLKDDIAEFEVLNQTEPSPKLWKKIGYAMLGAAALLATILGVKMANSSTNVQPAVIEESDQEQKTPESEKSKPTPKPEDDFWGELKPLEPLKHIPNLPDGDPVRTPNPNANESAEPTKQPYTPTPSPKPKNDESDASVSIKLGPGESVMSMETGKEITADGHTYIHNDDETISGERLDLEHTKNGESVVEEEDFKVKDATPYVAPKTGEEVTYDKASDEQLISVNKALAEMDWEDFFNSEETRLTLD